MELDRKPPRHVAIIMDGNGRWAEARGFPRILGHHAGAEAVRRTVESCREIGIQYLTLYAFSSENWERPRPEIDELMRLLVEFLRMELPLMRRHQIRLRASEIGDPAKHEGTDGDHRLQARVRLCLPVPR